MKGYERRVIEELRELELKMRALNDFMHCSGFDYVDSMDKGLLMVQIRAMRLYAETLQSRIERFSL